MKNDRISRLIEKLEPLDLDAILISSNHNRRYVSGFTGSSGYLLVSRQARIIATDFRYYQQATDEAGEFALFKIRGKLEEWFGDFIGQLNPRRLGFESEHVTVASRNTLARALKKTGVKTSLIATRNLVETLRTVKSKQEIENITKAIAISDAAIDNIYEIIKPGMSEIQAAWEIERFMRQSGSEPVSFPVICASGPNSALPHAQPSDRLINTGEPVVLDFGASINGYTSDLTRTVYLGQPDSMFRKLYNIVLKAQYSAFEGITSRINGKQADDKARRVIVEAGYGEYFGHSLGHGIGLEVHEGPYLGPSSEDILLDGMVFTVEPGIYIPGWGGIRIEDDVVLERGRVTTLSKAKKLEE
ncbi:MAG: aminopeptidase P family protein [Dehalococcoidaceae bacterium]|nr:aminopeptidase P family protein [Dehalococcoidaceae bacterium]